MLVYNLCIHMYILDISIIFKILARDYISSYFLLGSVMIIFFGLLCCVFCLSSFCILCPMLSVSLDYPITIALSGFFNVYLSHFNLFCRILEMYLRQICHRNCLQVIPVMKEKQLGM